MFAPRVMPETRPVGVLLGGSGRPLPPCTSSARTAALLAPARPCCREVPVASGRRPVEAVA